MSCFKEPDWAEVPPGLKTFLSFGQKESYNVPGSCLVLASGKPEVNVAAARPSVSRLPPLLTETEAIQGTASQGPLFPTH